ncbi:MAG: hypothetical protein ACLP5E_11630 [Streptosporangiaceae bacterium]
MSSSVIVIHITDITSQSADALNNTVLALRRELLDIQGVQLVEQKRETTAEGAKSGSAIILGTLVISFSSSVPVLREIRGFFHDWLRRNDGKRATIQISGKLIDISGLSEEAIERLAGQTSGNDGDD